MKHVVATLATCLVIGAAVALASATAAVQAGPPPGLTVQGRVLWNFEALLHDTFGARYRGCLRAVSRYVLSFTADSYCASHPSYLFQGYSFTFARAFRSPYRLVSRTLRPGAFGNYPEPIRVDGRYVACDPASHKLLIRYGDVFGLSANLACLAPNQ